MIEHPTMPHRKHFEALNGLSNLYWGWGLEDDEFRGRILEAGLPILRPGKFSTGTSSFRCDSRNLMKFYFFKRMEKVRKKVHFQLQVRLAESYETFFFKRMEKVRKKVNFQLQVRLLESYGKINVWK